MRDNPEGSELDLAKGVHRRCKKNSPSVLSCIDMRTRKGCNRGSEVGTVHKGRDGEGQFPLRFKFLAEEGVVCSARRALLQLVLICLHSRHMLHFV